MGIVHGQWLGWHFDIFHDVRFLKFKFQAIDVENGLMVIIMTESEVVTVVMKFGQIMISGQLQSYLIFNTTIKMAFYIEFPELSASSIPIQNGRSVIAAFSTELVKQNIVTSILTEEGEEVTIRFAIRICNIHENVYNITVHLPTTEVKYCVNLMPRGEAGGSLSSELIKQGLRSCRNINAMTSKFFGLVAVHPYMGQIRVKIQINTQLLESLSQRRIFMGSLITQTMKQMNTFSGMLLHACNRIPSSALAKSLPEFFRKFYFGSNGSFKVLAEIKEILMLANYEGDGSVGKKLGDNQKRNSIPSYGQYPIFLQCYYRQKRRRQRMEMLWSCPLYESKQILVQDLFKESGDKQASTQSSSSSSGEDHKYLFSTITILSMQKDKQRAIDERAEARLTVVPIRYSYSKSRNVDDQEEQEQQEVIRGTFDKPMVIKLPHSNDVTAFERVRWEKDILTNLRGAFSVYLPKYYHTVQEHHACKNALLMDFIPGLTLHEKLLLQRLSISPGTRLQLAAHLTNAILFLQNYAIAHLDITPANIIVDREYPKLIDFGQAYSYNTFQKYLSKNDTYCHEAGRSFPYCPPQTTSRTRNFSSSQDVFSLGVILLQMFFDIYLPSPNELKRLYIRGGLQNRLLHAPEISEYIGQSEHYALLGELALLMLSQNEKRRPYPWCIGLVLRKLCTLAR